MPSGARPPLARDTGDFVGDPLQFPSVDGAVLEAVIGALLEDVGQLVDGIALELDLALEREVVPEFVVGARDS